MGWPRESRLDEAAIAAAQKIQSSNLEIMLAGFRAFRAQDRRVRWVLMWLTRSASCRRRVQRSDCVGGWMMVLMGWEGL